MWRLGWMYRFWVSGGELYPPPPHTHTYTPALPFPRALPLYPEFLPIGSFWQQIGNTKLFEAIYFFLSQFFVTKFLKQLIAKAKVV
jgi:hypothetical protein